jgi:hypothetical protein
MVIVIRPIWISFFFLTLCFERAQRTGGECLLVLLTSKFGLYSRYAGE